MSPKTYQTPFFIDDAALHNLKLVAVAYSHVDRDDFPTKGSYEAELEVEDRAEEVIAEIAKLGVAVKGYAANQYILTNILVDKPDLVVNLVDTVKGKDGLQPAFPGAMEMSGVKYTGAGLRGLVLGNDRHMFKQMLIAHDIPTPAYKFIKDMRSKVPAELGLPLIVKLNESGGSVGIDNKAVKDTLAAAVKKIAEMLSAHKMNVIVEKFIPGPEITAVAYHDGRKRHVFLGQKIFRVKPDGKYDFTSLESYDDAKAYYYKVPAPDVVERITPLVLRAFETQDYRDYAKFDIRYDEETKTPYFIDCNPNTAFGPDKGLPMTEVLSLHGIEFTHLLKSLLSKYAVMIKNGS